MGRGRPDLGGSCPGTVVPHKAVALRFEGSNRPPTYVKVDDARFARLRPRLSWKQPGVAFCDVDTTKPGHPEGAASDPQELARRLMSGLGDRWDHTREVAARARSAAAAVPDEERSLLVGAAWLHDIGYSHEAAQTGFHPLDGARYLQSVGAPMDLVGAVAHHSCARYEAEERGLATELKAFTAPSEAVMDALAYADMTTGPTGHAVSVEERLAEILERYSPDDPVHLAITRARVDLASAVRRTEILLAGTSPDHPM